MRSKTSVPNEKRRRPAALTFDSVANTRHETSLEEVSLYSAGPMSKHPVVSVKGHPEVIWVRPDMGVGSIAHPVAFGIGAQPEEIPWRQVRRSLMDGYLPIVISSWSRGSLEVQQTSFAVLLYEDSVVTGHEKQIAAIELSFSNTSVHKTLAEDWLCFVPLHVSARGVPPFPYNTYDLFEVVGHLPSVEVVDSQFDDRILRYKELPIGVYRATGIQGSRLQGGQRFRIELRPGETKKLELFVTSSQAGLSPEQVSYLRSTNAEKELARRKQSLNTLLLTGMRINVPEPTINSIYKAQILHSQSQLVQAADRPYRLIAQGFQGVWPWEAMKFAVHWDALGFHDDVRRCLEYFLETQGRFPPHGTIKNADAVFGGTIAFEESGWENDLSTFYGQLAALNRGKEREFPNWMNSSGALLHAFASHYWYTRDVEWLNRVAPALVRACDWIVSERQTTMQHDAAGHRVLHYGLLPVGRAYDTAEEAMRKLESAGELASGESNDRLAPLDTYYPCWTDSYSSIGLTQIANALADASHPDAARLVREANAYREDLLEVMRRTRTKDHRLPPYPERLYRPPAWAEFATGALAYLDTSFMNPEEDVFAQLESFMKAKWNRGAVGLTGGMEKNGDPHGTSSYYVNFSEDIWHRAWLLRGETEKALLAFYSMLAYGLDRQTLATVERFHVSEPRYAPFFMDTSASARVCGLIRQALILEEDRVLHLLLGVPRKWLAHGEMIRIEAGVTKFARLELFVLSQVRMGRITVVLDLHQLRNKGCDVIKLRVPHPGRKRIGGLRINGSISTEFDPQTEIVSFPVNAGTTKIEMTY